MKYLSVAETAAKWQISERSVRNYCAQGRVQGAELHGRVWSIPETAVKPERVNKIKQSERSLLNVLQEEKASRYAGGIYHKTQIELTYNSNHMEGSRLTHEQTRYIFETNTIGVENEVLNVDDVIEFNKTESDEEQEEKDYIDGYNLDVDRLIFGELLVSIPGKILCREDCKGLCPVCGTNLNVAECGCDRDVLDPRMSVFKDILNNFKEV